MVSVWSTVHSHAAHEPAMLPGRDGPISHASFVDSIVPEARSGHWYTNKPLCGCGDLQTLLASGQYEQEYPVWYGRRMLKWHDGSQVSGDYVLATSGSAPPNWEKDVLHLPDQDTPRLPLRTRILQPHEVRARDEDTSAPLFIALHGLTGGSHENYIRSTICEIAQHAPGLEYVVLTSRGCNRTLITTPALFNGAWTDDLRQFIMLITKKQPNRPIFLAGFSLGASILANYIGQEGSKIAPQIMAAIVVSNPWDLLQSHYHLSSSFLGKRLYMPTMGQNLTRLIRNNRAVLMQDPQFKELEPKLKHIKLIYDFDNLLTGPVFGFSCAEEYYRMASSVNRVRSIRVPTLVLHADDDPICAGELVPLNESAVNPYIHTVLTSQGGHLGWFPARGPRWHSTVMAKYLAGFIDTVDLSGEVKAAEVPELWFRGDRFQTVVSSI